MAVDPKQMYLQDNYKKLYGFGSVPYGQSEDGRSQWSHKFWNVLILINY